MPDQFPLDPDDRLTSGDRGGFVALAVLSAAAGAAVALLLAPASGSATRDKMGRGIRGLPGEAAATIAQLQRDIRRRKHQSRREKRLVGLAGFLVGAGLTALVTPESGRATRKLLGGTLGRIRVGTVNGIERLRHPEVSRPAENPVRSVQELGRDPNDVF